MLNSRPQSGMNSLSTSLIDHHPSLLGLVNKPEAVFKPKLRESTKGKHLVPRIQGAGSRRKIKKSNQKSAINSALKRSSSRVSRSKLLKADKENLFKKKPKG